MDFRSPATPEYCVGCKRIRVADTVQQSSQKYDTSSYYPNVEVPHINTSIHGCVINKLGLSKDKKVKSITFQFQFIIVDYDNK